MFVNIGPLCERDCGTSYKPLCGTDGNTYNNSCELQVAMCYDERLRKASDGVCPGKLKQIRVPNC